MGEEESSLALILGGFDDDDDEPSWEPTPKFEDEKLSREDEARRAAEGAAARRLKRAFQGDNEKELLAALKDAIAIVNKKR